MKKFYTEVLIPRSKTGDRKIDGKNWARKTLIEANMNLGASQYP
jgi:hypothetical protein